MNDKWFKLLVVALLTAIAILLFNMVAKGKTFYNILLDEEVKKTRVFEI